MLEIRGAWAARKWNGGKTIYLPIYACIPDGKLEEYRKSIYLANKNIIEPDTVMFINIRDIPDIEKKKTWNLITVTDLVVTLYQDLTGVKVDKEKLEKRTKKQEVVICRQVIQTILATELNYKRREIAFIYNMDTSNITHSVKMVLSRKPHDQQTKLYKGAIEVIRYSNI